MNIKNSLWIIALSSSLLFNTAVADEINNTKWEVYQLVWNKLIPTSMDVLLNFEIKADKCLKFEWNTIYISDEKNIIPTWFFWELTEQEADLINKTSEKCN